MNAAPTIRSLLGPRQDSRDPLRWYHRLAAKLGLSRGDDYCPDVADIAEELDWSWFAAHPKRHHRVRQALAGELPGATEEHQVVVRRSLAGVCFAFLSDEPLPPDDASEQLTKDLFVRIALEQGRLDQILSASGEATRLWMM